MTIQRSIVFALVVSLVFPTSVLADTFVTVDTTQNGGVFNNNSPTLVISHLTNDPLFTLTNGATTSNVEALIIGSLDSESGQLLIEAGSSLNNDGTGVIGTYGSENVLGGYAYLGLNEGSSGSATVTGPGSTWTNSGILNVGYGGTGMLDITNGGVVTNQLGYLGFTAGSSGAVAVNGSGSEMTAISANVIGVYGEGSLEISNGGRVANPTGYIGQYAGSMGTVTVVGAGSRWENYADLDVGLGGTGELNVSEGAYVSSQNSDIGLSSNGNGTVNLSGGDTLWEHTNSLTVGNEGMGTLNVGMGAMVTSGFLDIGLQTDSMGAVDVSGGSAIELSDNLIVGGLGHGSFNMSGSSQFVSSKIEIGESVGSTGEVILVGVGTNAEITGDVSVGGNGSGSLIISGGASLTAMNNDIAIEDGSNGEIVVTGQNSHLNIGNKLRVGYRGNGTMAISDGALVTSEEASISTFVGSEGTVAVSGANSLWNNAGHISVGQGVSGDLIIDQGGRVQTGSLTVSALSSLAVDGAGSVLESVEITAGLGNYSYVDITDGGTINSSTVVIGTGKTGNPNTHVIARVEGAGSVWNANDSIVGDDAYGRLFISDGAAFNSANLVAGTGDGDGGIEVNGQGSGLNITSDFLLGNGGFGFLRIIRGKTTAQNAILGTSDDGHGRVIIGTNGQWESTGSLVVGDGAKGEFIAANASNVTTYNTQIGSSTSDANGLVQIQNVSAWENSSDFHVGKVGYGHLQISTGSTLNVGGNAWIGYEPGSTGFVEAVQGASWTIASDLNVGFQGSGTLWVFDDSEVAVGRHVYLGVNSGSTGTLWIKDAASRFEVGDFFDVGRYGTGELSIENGGLLVSPGGGINAHYESYIGHYAGSTGVATVTGDGSRWEMSRSLTVGSDGNGTLNILNGGYVTNHFSFIGANDGSVGSVMVAGEGSLWDSRSYIRMDETSSLTISNQGHVTTPWAADIAYDADSVATVLVTGENSKLTVGGFVVGRFGHGTMTIEDGGYASATNGTLIGFAGTGITRVTGAGSHLDINSLTVGVESGGNGTLQVLEGGLVTTNSSTSIGHRAGSIGRIDVDGVGSTLHVGYDLNIGISGDAQFNITDGGHVIVDNHAWLHASQIDPIATVSGTGSKWSIDNWLFIGQNTNTSSTVDILDGGLVSVNGTTRVYNNDFLNIVGGTLRTGSLEVDAGGTFNLDGGRLLLDGGVAEGIMFTANDGAMIGGTGTIEELMIGAGGILAPGESPGLLHANMAELLGEGTYQWEINTVDGLAGESLGWDLVTFDTLQLTAASNDEFVIEVTSLTELNETGRLADFDPFESHTWLIAASNGVDPFDLDSFSLDLTSFENLYFDGNFSLSTGAANYGGFAQGLFLNYTAATVPEPNSLALLLIAFGMATRMRRR